MSEQLWYVYHQQQQLGPFEARQVAQLLSNNMISQEAYVFKVGWKDWRPIEESLDQLGLEKKENGHDTPNHLKRRLGAPRATISGRIIIHNNGQLVIGSGVNISATGIFIETEDQIFKIGEKLSVTVKAEGLKKQFNTTAEVIRLNTDPKYPIGYGLRFINLDISHVDDIQEVVDQQNNTTNKNDFKQQEAH
ncbi:MAG: PilZ domain-containing protein [Bdellovibrionota bacterium]